MLSKDVVQNCLDSIAHPFHLEYVEDFIDGAPALRLEDYTLHHDGTTYVIGEITHWGGTYEEPPSEDWDEHCVLPVNTRFDQAALELITKAVEARVVQQLVNLAGV